MNGKKDVKVMCWLQKKIKCLSNITRLLSYELHWLLEYFSWQYNQMIFSICIVAFV
jgi:hypothetical protein